MDIISLFYGGKNYSCKSQGHLIGRVVSIVPHFSYTLHSLVLVFTAQTLTEVNRGTK